MPAGSELRFALRALMQRGAAVPLSDDDFNSLALRVFQHQFSLNSAYRRYCERRNLSPAHVEHWTGIPAVPTAAFKEVPLIAGNAVDAELAFKTSGTTRGIERRGVHYILDSTLYNASLISTFKLYVLPDHARMRMLSLVPVSTQLPDSSLSYMVTQIIHELGAEGSEYFATARDGLAVQRLNQVLAGCAAAGEPVCMLGTSLAYVHWLAATKTRISLPAGSRLMDTGGFKGLAKTVSPDELRAGYTQVLGISPRMCINEYGMTEMCSQYYDASLAKPADDDSHASVKSGPPWLRARVVDPDTLAPVRPGNVGILQHFDLANLDSVSAIQTEDLASEADQGFVLLGRAPGATPRGCSIAMDVLLSTLDNR
jgi:hypothetical protein